MIVIIIENPTFNQLNFFYYRGVLPFVQRKRLWEKYRAKCRKQRPSANQSEIVAGSQVCMKNSPMYQPGAIGMYILKMYLN